MRILARADSSGPAEASRRFFGALGGIWGSVAAFALGGLRFALSDPPQRQAEFIGDLAFLAVYLAPFALALVALRWRNPAHRAVAWLAGAALAFLASFTTFSGVSLVFLPAALLLGISGLRAGIAAGWRNAILAALVAGGLIVINAGAWFSLFSREDPLCWELIRSADGSTEWQTAPFTFTGTISASGVGPIGRTCTSNMISPAEGLLSLGLLALGGIGLFILLPRWQSKHE